MDFAMFFTVDESQSLKNILFRFFLCYGYVSTLYIYGQDGKNLRICCTFDYRQLHPCCLRDPWKVRVLGKRTAPATKPAQLQLQLQKTLPLLLSAVAKNQLMKELKVGDVKSIYSGASLERTRYQGMPPIRPVVP